MSLIGSLKMRWLKWVWQHTPSCAEVARLSSQRLEQPLGLGTRLRIRLHLVICVWCHRYLKQLEFMHQHLRLVEQHEVSPARRALSPDAKRRIIRDLHEAGA